MPETQYNDAVGRLGPTFAYVTLFVTTTALVVGIICRFLKELCRRLKRKRTRKVSKMSTISVSSHSEPVKLRRESSIRGSLRSIQEKLVSASTETLTPRGVTFQSPAFSIPKTRSNVLQQPLPEFSQSRTGPKDDKRISLVAMYFTDEQLALESIEPDEYKNLDHTVTIGTDQNLGQLNFIVKYSDRTRKLTVHLICGRGFPPRDFSGSLDTCVTIALLPDRTNRKQTAIHRRSTSPLYNETFVFRITADEDVYSMSLLFVTFYYDQYSHSHVLGEEQVPLVAFHLGDETMLRCFLRESSVSQTQSSSLVSAIQSMSHALVGDILISLLYTTKEQTLNVSIMKASNLSTSLAASNEKLYVKAVFSHEGQKVGKRKTELHEVGTKYTVFNEILLFRVPRETLERATLTVSLNRYNVVGKSSTIGEVAFSPMSKGPESVIG
ncbi:synaptotagmin-C [Nematostella vectensis]|uniref:synaptotagmin-C n=1 Tax=Nematostella vectensis TaxID=45351 RepID=UPI002076DEE0|nr:synaptotagmin-C [Nematostella vectensis]